MILPKLFRRLAEYLTLDETGGVDLTGFPAFLAPQATGSSPSPLVHATTLDTLVQVSGSTLR